MSDENTHAAPEPETPPETAPGPVEGGTTAEPGTADAPVLTAEQPEITAENALPLLAQLIRDVVLAQVEDVAARLARRRRHERGDRVDVRRELEGVERGLERLAADEPAARLGRLAGGDRAVRAEPAEGVVDRLRRAEDCDTGVALRRLAHRDELDRDALCPARDLRLLGDHRNERAAVLAQAVAVRDVVGDRCRNLL